MLQVPSEKAQRAPAQLFSPVSQIGEFSNEPQILVREARTSDDRQKVFEVRWAGYQKYFGSREEVIDGYDYQNNVTLLLATDAVNRPMGTLRILDRAEGKLELDAFLDVDALVPRAERPCVEATRFTVPRHPRSREIKLALWKAFHEYAQAHGSQSMVIWATRSAARMYQALLFEDVGEVGAFTHPSLGNKLHRTFKVHLPTVEKRYHEDSHPLRDLFFGPSSAGELCA